LIIYIALCPLPLCIPLYQHSLPCAIIFPLLPSKPATN
jgi:hypothetical protein